MAGHERIYAGPWLTPIPGQRLESSWYALPHLKVLRERGIALFHIVRDPRTWIGSWVSNVVPRHVHHPDIQFSKRFCRAQVPFDANRLSEAEAAAKSWLYFNELTEKVDLLARRRIEDFGPEEVRILADAAGTHVTDRDIEVALKRVPRSFNRKVHRDGAPLIAQLTEETRRELFEVARSYGYEVEENHDSDDAMGSGSTRAAI